MEENSYTVDPDNSIELSRLLRQNELLTRTVSGYLPEAIDPLTIHSVLDIGCGPGGWLVNLARRYPHIQGTGLDISEAMITYGRQLAAAEQLACLDFVAGSFLRLPFESERFDFVEARSVQWFLAEEDRDDALREWMRVVRPGGWIRLTEGQWPQFNSQAFEIILALFLKGMRQKYGERPYPGIPYVEASALAQEIGTDVTPDPLNKGGYFYLKHMLENLGCTAIQIKPHLLDFSAAAVDHDVVSEDFLMANESHRPFHLASIPGLTSERLSSLYEAARRGVSSPDFIGMQMFLTVWGQKPV